MSRVRAMATAVALWSLIVTSPAGAGPASQPTPTVSLLRQAIDAISSARFRQALELLEQAEKQAREPRLVGRVQLYLGITRAVLGDSGRARQHFRTALEKNPELSLDPRRMRSDVVQMLEDVRSSTLGELEVVAKLVDATVSVDGRSLGLVPLTRKVPVGRHLIEVHDAAGRRRFSEHVVIHHGHPTRVEVEVEDRPPAPKPPARQPEKRQRIWTWVVGGTATAALLAGAAVWISASIDHEEFVSLGDDEGRRGEQLRDQIEAKQTAIYTLFGTGGALAVTAVVLYFVEGGTSSRRDASIQPMLGPHRAGLVLTWRH